MRLKTDLKTSYIKVIISLVSACLTPLGSHLIFKDAHYSTIYFETNGGFPISSRTIKVGDRIFMPEPVKEGFNFVDWYSDISMTRVFNLNLMPAFDVKVYAKWNAELYRIDFDTIGGNEVESIYGYFGDDILLPPPPMKEGYSFNGWFRDPHYTQLFNVSTFPSTNLTLYAKWNINQYTITFETNGGTEIDSITGNFGDIVMAPRPPTKAGYSFYGWYADANLTQNIPVPTSIPPRNLTLYAKWTINRYTISFETNGGTVIESITGNFGEPILVPNEPTKEGHTFNGWYTDANLTQSTLVPTTIPSRNMTLYAKWTINRYTISFETNGGDTIQPQSYIYQESLNIPTPIKVGNSFEGWFLDVHFTQDFTLTNMPAHNLMLFAKWIINQYTITFETNGGTVIDPITGNFGDPVIIPGNPTREQAIFSGWYFDSNLTQVTEIPTTIPSRNMTFYAKWIINQYTITFETNGGTVIDSIAGNFGDPVIIPSNPTKEGHQFQGWFEDAAFTIPASITNTIPALDITYFAKWSILKFTITWVNYDGTILETDTEVAYGILPTYDNNEPSRPWIYDFGGYWYTYTFSGWDPIISPATYDQIYSAVFYKQWRFCGNEDMDGWLCK